MKKLLMIYKRDGNKVLDEYIDEYRNYDKSKLIMSMKIDGTSCLIKDGKLYKRYDNKKNKEPEKDWIFCYKNDKHNIYWIPVTDKDKYHLDAWKDFKYKYINGTYELVGPKINGNKHNFPKHMLVYHESLILKGFLTSNEYFTPTGNETKDDWIYRFKEIDACNTLSPHLLCEGIVLWDKEKMEPMFKIRKKDLGMEW